MTVSARRQFDERQASRSEVRANLQGTHMTIDPLGDEHSLVIPEDWWRFAGMNQFKPCDAGFYPFGDTFTDVEVIPLTSIQSPIADPGFGDLKMYKLVPVLWAFRTPGCTVPPIVVERILAPGAHQYRVRDGVYRLLASVACGYKKIPAMIAE